MSDSSLHFLRCRPNPGAKDDLETAEDLHAVAVAEAPDGQTSGVCVRCGLSLGLDEEVWK